MVRKIYLFVCTVIVLSGCGSASYHDVMIENAKKTINQESYTNIKDAYTESLVTEVTNQQEFISIINDKSLGDVLKELERIDDNYYFLRSSDILIPRSRIKLYTMDDINNYLRATLDKELIVEKSGKLSIVKIVNSSEIKKQSIEHMPFRLQGEIAVEELIKLITAQTGYGVFIGQYMEDINKFKSSVITINSTYLIDALNALGHTKNVYVDIDYDKEVIAINRYKDTVIELNIPLLNLKTSSETSTKETSGESKMEHISQIVLFDEIDKMVKNIISNDKVSTYHIDKSSGLIFLKTTKSVESAVRTLAKAYEMSFAREATIDFERIEIVLNKNREYGISSLAKSQSASTTTTIEQTLSSYDKESTLTSTVNMGTAGSITSGGNLAFSDQAVSRLISIAAKANNEIGKILNYSKNTIVLKNNIPTVQSTSQNTDYIEKIETTVVDTAVSTEATVNTIKDGTSITAMAKISRDKIFLNITPNIKKLIRIGEAKVGDSIIQLPQYNDQSYNISREVRVGETAIVGSIIVHDDAKEYQGILPLEGFAIGGTDSKSYVRREIVYVVTLRNIKGF